MKKNSLLPNYDDGRFFISPILGCDGYCKYCYLGLHEYAKPHENLITIDDIMKQLSDCKEFVYGKNGTIISIGAWGDIFPPQYVDLLNKSILLIREILQIGNPVQIMSKFSLDSYNIKLICESQVYQEQLLYSTTITTISRWKQLEPNTVSPQERLETCKSFYENGTPTNVLLKPFLPGITDIELTAIANLLLDYSIQYCVVGILYWDETIQRKMNTLREFEGRFLFEMNNQKDRHLDCNGDILLNATDVLSLRRYVDILRAHGVNAFLKSSCVSSNILHEKNPSNYYKHNSDYCIQCGNCN